MRPVRMVQRWYVKYCQELGTKVVLPRFVGDTGYLEASRCKVPFARLVL